MVAEQFPVPASGGGGTTPTTNLVHDELAELEQSRKMADMKKGGDTFLLDEDGIGYTPRTGYCGDGGYCCFSNQTCEGLRHHGRVILAHPKIALCAIFVFLLVAGTGVTSIYVVDQNQRQDLERTSYALASETADFFADQLDKAIFPLKALVQLVEEMEIFHQLNDQVGSNGQPGSIPFRPPAEVGGLSLHRNISSLAVDRPNNYTYTNQEISKRFDKISQQVKENANMPGSLVGMQICPSGVITHSYPLVNTEDFPDGIELSFAGAMGLDLLHLPYQRKLVEQTFETPDVPTIAGPIVLRGCRDGVCDPTVRQAFVIRLGVQVPGYDTYATNEAKENHNFNRPTYPNRWGCVCVVVNWEELVIRSGIYETFEERGLGFHLYRTDIVVDPETSAQSEEYVDLAKTENFDTPGSSTVSVPLPTFDNEWTMVVSYPTHRPWVMWSIISTGILALLLSVLVETILIQKQQYKTMEKKYLDDVAQPQKQRLKMFLDAAGGNSKGAGNKNDTQVTTVATGSDMPSSGTPAGSSYTEDDMMNAKPIADLYPNCTLMFGDIVGFTSWSSEREPALVLCLLQNVFYAFDKTAQRRGIFKVETVGDCYVAAAGFPEAQPDHAVRMTKFAIECRKKMAEVTQKLESRLGPDTSSLRMRFGLNSGPITAGILVGENSGRLQLFGDTMNCTARMESLSERNRIHISSATAELLRQAGKDDWLEARPDMVHVKGKGQMQTYYLNWSNISHKLDAGTGSGDGGGEMGDFSSFHEDQGHLWDVDDDDSVDKVIQDVAADHSKGGTSSTKDGSGTTGAAGQAKTARLVDWHVDLLVTLLKRIVVRRGGDKNKKKYTRSQSSSSQPEQVDIASTIQPRDGVTTLLNEVKEIIELPKFDSRDLKNVGDINTITISDVVVAQLKDYVTQIAQLYHTDNPFHNFEHASHVVMAVHKLLTRIVSPEQVNYQRKSASKIASDLHDHTFGITSDPLTHFAVVLSALVHDVDHTGVSNGQLAIENPDLAAQYRSQSIAEQNSVDLAWRLMMQDQYRDLQACVFTNQEEFARFRQIVVNSVLATDIFDKELKTLRNLRWDKAFHPDRFSIVDGGDNMSTTHSTISEDSSRPTSVRHKKSSNSSSTNRKATIVIEHIIQASDVAHTMQHWNVYTKWNEKLFQEMYVAYKKGRSEKDPSEGWYKGELWFYDNYVIPLAQKLEECGVFGVASDECLFNALENRRERASRGQSVVDDFVAKINKNSQLWT